MCCLVGQHNLLRYCDKGAYHEVCTGQKEGSEVNSIFVQLLLLLFFIHRGFCIKFYWTNKTLNTLKHVFFSGAQNQAISPRIDVTTARSRALILKYSSRTRWLTELTPAAELAISGEIITSCISFFFLMYQQTN